MSNHVQTLSLPTPGGMQAYSPERPMKTTKPKDHFKKVKGYSQKMRASLTPQEERVLGILKTIRRKYGIQFKKQFHIHPYIVDFYLKTCGIVIECDGKHHRGSDLEYDSRRDSFLEKLGLKIIRIDNDVIDFYWPSVYKMLETALLANHCKDFGHMTAIRLNNLVKSGSVFFSKLPDVRAFYSKGK